MKNVTNEDGIIVDVDDDCNDCKVWNKDKDCSFWDKNKKCCIKPSYMECRYE